MNFLENSEQAADYLRQAVPTMVKYNIVPNPLNYTLWYSYYSKAFPLLNKELDETIQRYGTCPPSSSQSLFLEHIERLDGDNKEQLASFQKSLSNVMGTLSESIDLTSQQTTSYSEALKSNLLELDEQGITETVAPVLDKLNQNANAICNANEEFQGKLQAAQAEIDFLKQELENSRKEAKTDPLTGLYNRRMLESIYNQFVTENVNDDLSLVIMDIDKFKLFNDTHGHLLGDQILKFVGQLLQKECKEAITPIRFGGEEFALLCPNYDLKQAQEFAETVRVKLSSVLFHNKRTGESIPPVTASFGVATKQKADLLTQVIDRADKALYAAKNAGRNQVKASFDV
ncbi:GGDEF domain-containing protein [Paraglaciecola sp.]|uniref:GGDEF domain-containing protein n=1 Tax=Paraglaciecola sp. TaxID=1920173 RepID=UPI00326683D4